ARLERLHTGPVGEPRGLAEDVRPGPREGLVGPPRSLEPLDGLFLEVGPERGDVAPRADERPAPAELEVLCAERLLDRSERELEREEVVPPTRAERLEGLSERLEHADDEGRRVGPPEPALDVLAPDVGRRSEARDALARDEGGERPVGRDPQR